MIKTPDIISRIAFDSSPEVLGFEFTFKQILSQKYESPEQIILSGFGKYEQTKKLCVMLKREFSALKKHY